MYTFARLGVFLVTWGVLWGLSRLVFEGGSVINLWILLLAVIVSAVISLFALGSMRDKVALKLQERAQSINARIEESRRAEDID